MFFYFRVFSSLFEFFFLRVLDLRSALLYSFSFSGVRGFFRRFFPPSTVPESGPRRLLATLLSLDSPYSMSMTSERGFRAISVSSIRR